MVNALKGRKIDGMPAREKLAALSQARELSQQRVAHTKHSGIENHGDRGWSRGLTGHRGLLRAALSSGAEPVVHRQIHSVLSAVVGQEVERELRKRKRTTGPLSPELFTHSLASTYISMLTWWLNSKSPSPARDMDAAYRVLILPCLDSIFG